MKPLPTTARGVKTRNKLIAAARVVFERDGFLDARLVDIAAEAECSTGSFYTYFDSKDEIFAAVLKEATEDMLYPGVTRREHEAHPFQQIESSNRAYFAAYERNAKLMGLLEQVAIIDPHFRELRRRRSAEFSRRNAAAIERWQKSSIVDPALDPMMASRALSVMVSRLAYYTYVLEEASTLDELVYTCTRLWCNALRIPVPEAAQ